MLKWVASTPDCLSTAKFVLKVDDDAFVNPAEMWNSLEHALLHTATTKTLVNFLPPAPKTEGDQEVTAPSASESIDYLMMGDLQTAVPDRNLASKWYLPPRFYPLNIFPKFLSGSGYVVSTSLAPILYQCAIKTPYLNLEDVFLSGICATTQLGLKLTPNLGFKRAKPLVGGDYVCYYKTSALIHPLTPEEMEHMWVKIGEELNCDTFYFFLIKCLTSFFGFFQNLFRL